MKRLVRGEVFQILRDDVLILIEPHELPELIRVLSLADWARTADDDAIYTRFLEVLMSTPV